MVMGPISLPPPVDEQSLKKIHPFFKAYPALLPRFIIYFCASRTCNVRQIAAPTTVVRCGHIAAMNNKIVLVSQFIKIIQIK
ncbi:hypothetical protein QTP88_008472 [Uroleucon formosanum]